MKRLKMIGLLFIAALFLCVLPLAACSTGNGDDTDENETFRLEVFVADEEGAAVAGASVTGDGLNGKTDSNGRVVFNDLAVQDTSFTIAAEGYISESRTITTAEIAEADYSVTISATLLAQAPVEPGDPDEPEGYTPRSENYLNFSVGFGEDKAYYYWYAEYTEDAFVVTVDILDDDIFLSAENIGYSDNIEFIVQENSATVGLSAGKSLDVMVNPKTLNGWARYAVDTESFGEDGYYTMLQTGDLSVSGEERSADKDGYDGYSIRVAIDYWLLGEKDDLLGNVTIIPSARNRGPETETYWRSYTGYGCRWSKANMAVRVQEDGSFCANYFDIPDFEQLIKEQGIGEAGKTLQADMAAVSADEAVREYTAGANLFTDRDYLADSAGMPAALENSSYIYAPIAADYEFTVEEEGYVVVAIPSTGYDSVIEYFGEQGFKCIAEELPRIGYSNHGTDGITEMTDYFVKWCKAGESYHAEKWCVVFFGARETYEQDYWVANAAAINLINTPETIERFADENRQWQGIPGIEAVPLENGGTRLWTCWITGSNREPSVGNYCLYSFSDDGGETWMRAFAIAFDENNKNSRTFDPSLFYDGDGNLWLWWNQTNYSSGDKYVGIWCAKISNPGVAVNGLEDLNSFEISQAKRVCDGLKMNKPTILSNGDWAFFSHNFTRQGYTEMWVSSDKGETWSKKSEMYAPNALFANETAFAETVRDGKTVYMAINRTNDSYNLAVNYSYDEGLTWTDGVEWDILGASSRPMLKTLPSGNVVYIQHYNTTGRSMMSIWLSEDGGVTWPHCMVLDARSGVSYPDVTLDAQGNIYVVWDHDRYGDKEILMAKLTEEELLAIDGTVRMDEDRIVTISALGVMENIDTLFIGDSYTDTAFWSAFYEQMKPVNGETIGISGSEADLWLGKVWEVARYEPENIVIHVGVNDIDRGESGADCAEDIIELIRHLRRDLPDTKIFYVSICNNNAFENKWAEYAVSNAAVKAFAEETEDVYFIDFNAAMLANAGNMANNGFSSDNLHLSAQGYELLTQTILEAIYEADGTQALVGGVVKDENGTPLAGAAVQIGELSTETGADGSFMIENVPVRASEIRIMLDGYSDYVRSVSLNEFIEEDFTITVDAVLVADKTGMITGTVQDILGNPIEGAEVLLGEIDIKAETGADGTFRLEGFVTGNYTVTVSAEGYADTAIQVSAQEFDPDNGYECALGAVEMMFEKTADLGTIGGTNAYETHVYVRRQTEGIFVYVFMEDGSSMPNDSVLEFWINTYSFVNSRTQNTIMLTLGSDGSVAANHYLAGKPVKIENVSGIVNTAEEKYFQVYVPYSFIGQFAPAFYAVDENTPIGLSMTIKKSGSTKFDIWTREDMIGSSLTEEVVRGKTKDYIIFDGNGALNESMKEELITLSVFDELVAQSDVYQEGLTFSQNMAAFDVPADMSTQTVKEDGFLFSDRDKHLWDGYRPAAIDGMTYLYKSVTKTAEVTASESGYLLMLIPSVRTVDEGWTLLVEDMSNPGYATDVVHTVNYHIAYVEEGDTVKIETDGILLTNAAMQ